MTWSQPIRSPEGCRRPRCAHLEERPAAPEPHDLCHRNKPMHDPCSWHETVEEVRQRAERQGSM